MIRRSAVVLLAVVAAGGALSAQASDAPGVLVIPFASLRGTASRQSGDRVADMLRTELKANDMVNLVVTSDDAAVRPSRKSAPVAKSSGAVPKNDRALADAKNALTEAADFSKHLKFKQAADAYQSVIQTFEANAAYVDFAELVDAYLGLSVAQFRTGKERDGERTLAVVVRLDPEKTLDDSYPPVFQRIYDAIKKRLLAQPRGGVKIESSPTAATAYVDGKEIGPTPITVKDLVPGAHFVKVVTGGIPTHASKVDVVSGDVAKVTASARGGSAVADAEAEPAAAPAGPTSTIVAALAGNLIDEAVLNKATDVAGKAGAEFVVLGGMVKKETTLIAAAHLFDVKHQKLCPLMKVSFDAEMLGAQLEVYKLANDVVGKVSGCEVESIPAKVSRDPAASEGSAAVADASGSRSSSADSPRRSGGRRPITASSESAPPPEDTPPPAKPASKSASSGSERSPRSAIIARAEPKKPDIEEDVPRRKTAQEAEPEEPKGGVRRLEARETTDELQQSGGVGAVDEQPKGPDVKKALLITAIVVVVVGALAGGTVLIVSSAAQPDSGRATFHW